MMIENVIPAIVEKWPEARRGSPVRIQQDNAPSHIAVDDPEFVAAVAATGLEIELYCQPSNSPDTNVLDLGFFRAIQSLQYQMNPTSISDLIGHIYEAWNQMEPSKLNAIFLTLLACFNEIIKDGGGNSYSMPHLGKAKIIWRDGALPVTIEAFNFLDENENDDMEEEGGEDEMEEEGGGDDMEEFVAI
jgi:hypothetical protein